MSKSMRRFWIQLTADKKRFSILCTVLAVGLLFWARLIVVSNLPRTAVAREVAAVAAQDMAKGSDKASSKSPARVERASVQVAMSTVVSHDPFVISPRYFPKPATPANPTKEPDKSESKPVEEPDEIEARTFARLQASVERLKLEMALGNSVAVISGKSYQIGESVLGLGNNPVEFRLVEVKQRSVILEGEGHQFELIMSSPGG